MFNTIQAAIELLESAHVSTDLVWKRHDCVESLKKLAKPSELEQESDDLTAAYLSGVYDGKNKYAPQRTWVGLTDEEIDIWNIVAPSRLRDFVRCIEAKLREKNG